MVKKLVSANFHIEEVINLDNVTSATNGNSINTEIYHLKSIYIEVSGNTGAVTVDIEASPDNATWYTLNSTTYTSTNSKDIRGYVDHFPYIRTKTTAHSNATVKTTFTGRS